MNRRKTQYDGIGIMMLGFAVVLAIVVAIAGGFRAPLPPPDCNIDCLQRWNLSAQFSMAWAAWAVLFVSVAGGIIGAISLFLIYRTLREAQRSADAAEAGIRLDRELGIAQIRAYVTVEAAILRLSQHSGTIQLVIRVTNAGQSPALEVSALALLSWATTQDLIRPETLLSTVTGEAMLIDLPAGSNKDGLITMHWPPEHRDENTYLYWLQLEVTHTDVFEQRRTETFLFSIYVVHIELTTPELELFRCG